MRDKFTRFLRFTAVVFLFTFIMNFIFGALAMAQDLPAPVASTDFYLFVLQSLSTLKGAGTLAIIGVVIQILSKFILTPIFDGFKLDSKYKFLAFAVLAIGGAVVALMASGQSLAAALLSSSVMLLISQYGHRIYELFFEPADAPAPVAATASAPK